MTSGGNNFNYFAENHLIKLSAVSLFTAAFAVVPSFETTIREIYSPSPSPFFPFPPSAWKETPEIQLGGLGSAVALGAGSAAEPQPKLNLVHFNLKMTSGGNNFNYFSENQRIKLSAV